jgi:hypothetical protein
LQVFEKKKLNVLKEKKGWLQKKGQEGMKGWSRRYFTLKEHELLYYESDKTKTSKGVRTLLFSC